MTCKDCGHEWAPEDQECLACLAKKEPDFTGRYRRNTLPSGETVLYDRVTGKSIPFS